MVEIVSILLFNSFSDSILNQSHSHGSWRWCYKFEFEFKSRFELETKPGYMNQPCDKAPISYAHVRPHILFTLATDFARVAQTQGKELMFRVAGTWSRKLTNGLSCVSGDRPIAMHVCLRASIISSPISVSRPSLTRRPCGKRAKEIVDTCRGLPYTFGSL